MAIYGDGKHNENMEHSSPKFQIAEKTIYRTTVWTIESEDDTYYIRCQEDDIYDHWSVDSDNDGAIDPDSELGQKLIAMCEFESTVDDDLDDFKTYNEAPYGND